MSHPLVDQLHFTRSEFMRGLAGVTPEEAARHFEPLNCISWMVGHLAWHEQREWIILPGGDPLLPDVERFANGQPMSTPPLDEVLEAWQTITQASEAYLDSLTSQIFQTHFVVNRMRHPESIGTKMRRITYHYWYHLGEMQAIRQLLGHTDLPGFVGNINAAPYRPETP